MEQDAIGLTRVVERQDVRVIEPRCEVNFPDEAFARERFGDLGSQHLDGDVAVVSQVARKKHRRHAACAELSLDAIAIRERSCQRIRERIHAPM